MLLSDETAGLDEVATALKRSPEWLRRNWLKLHTEQNFPRKISAGWIWPRRAVESWLRSGGMTLPLPANQNDGGDMIDAAAAALKHRYGAST